MEKEVDIRRRIMRDFNRREEEFPNLREYNDYLEFVETIIFNLTNGIQVESTKRQIEDYKRQNRDQIQRNKLSKGLLACLGRVRQSSVYHRPYITVRISLYGYVYSNACHRFCLEDKK